MPTERWQRVVQLFTEAGERPVSLRADFLDRECGPDASLRDEIAALLAAADRAGDFLDAPALEAFARQVSREGWSVQPGDRIGSYTVERRLGAGAMGEVWRARDDRLGRDVAIKLLLPHPENASERVRALQDEARAAGGLNHVNVLTVYDVGDFGGSPYLVTECLEGEPLRVRLAAGPLSLDAALDVALQVARGLHAVHERGIVHRDLKPENIFMVADGRVKILDFGLATRPEAAHFPVAGTVAYMAPEQVRGEPVDRRADLFALGVILHEMLAGGRPLQAPAGVAVSSPQMPPALAHIVLRCLARVADERFATAADVASALESVIRARSAPAPVGALALLRRPAVVAAVLAVALALAAGAWRRQVVASRVRWARGVAAPEIARLSARGDMAEAFLLARQALDVVPDDPYLRQLWLDVSIPAVMDTEPSGADVAIAAYRTPGPQWHSLGRTPLARVRIPRGLFRVHITKAGYEAISGSGSPGALERYRLDPVGAMPQGMVHVTGGRDPTRFGAVGDLEEYWIDRFEVTNRQFQEFVDQGGYRRPEYWQEPFVDGGRSLPWSEAIGRFTDATGRPGPATWSAGTFPAGQADFPVGGVSWYEAAAYAVFAGKSLPTVYHWYRAADLGRFADILAVSNFGGTGPAPVGHHAGLGPFGTYDMAGNVKEWCQNETGEKRFLLGGGWNEARYMFSDSDAKGPFERAPNYGFRTARYVRPLPAALTAAIRMEALGRAPRGEVPVGDAIFAVYRRQNAYDRTPLDAVVEASEETAGARRETITFAAAYGAERVRAFLFLPRNASPPYQTVVFFPAADAFLLRSSADMSLASVNFITRSGRALLYPVYKGTYERRIPDEGGPNAERDLQTAWSRDFGRAIDYLETRPDIDRSRLAFYGVSAGADAGVVLTALDPRLTASVLQGTGLPFAAEPETNLLNYAPRVRVPTLMLNGRYDFEAPVESAQDPLFALLGPPPAHKRHVLLESGHALPMGEAAREVLAWLDRYLGPVVQGASGRPSG